MVEYGEMRLTLDQPLGLTHARWFRGAMIRVSNRVEFHNHAEKGLVYQHPLVRYDTSDGLASVAGLARCALLVRSLPHLDCLYLGSERLLVTGRSMVADRVPIGPSGEMIAYQFQTPYLGLNQENYETWKRGQPTERSRLLERVLIGNLLSFSKAIGLNVSTRLRAEVNLIPSGFQELKPGLCLLGFDGGFRVNFLLPERWGIGKSSARGFGTFLRGEV